MKKLKLKESVKSALIISSLFITITGGLLLIGKRNKYLEQQKMTEMCNQISQK